MKKMNILTVSGSTREESSNTKLLLHLDDVELSERFIFQLSSLPQNLPLFQAQLDANPLPGNVVKWRNQLSNSDGLVICIPEYIHNMPALIKNALEWVTSSGELAGKKVLAITLTPHEPRGEKAMQSLLWSLKALDANVIVSLPLYQSEISYVSNEMKGEGVELLKEALSLFL
jgi:chromate reductase